MGRRFRTPRRPLVLRLGKVSKLLLEKEHMEIPIHKQGSYLIASVQSALVDDDLTRLHDTLLDQVGRTRPRGVVLEIAALDVVDSFATRTFRDLALKVRRRGAEMVIAGIQPDVAIAVARFGLDLEVVPTVHDREAGLAYLKHKTRAPQGRQAAHG